MTGIIERARKLRAMIEENAQKMDAATASEYPELFPEWSGDGKTYKTGEMLRRNGELMKVLQDHVSQPGWTPEAAPSLFAKVLTDPAGGNILPWVQPGSTNPYRLGDMVTHNGKTWMCSTDNNVWEPGVYGWDEVA